MLVLGRRYTARLYRVASRYQLTAEEAAALYKQTITKKTAAMTEVWDIKQFMLYMDDRVIERKPNPYGFIPFIIFPNLRQPKQYWGLSDIPALREPQRELNRVLPQDRAREAQNEQLMVQSGIHSRRTAMDNLAVRDPEAEFEKWMAERRRILEMNSEFKAQPACGKARERSTTAEMDAAL